MGPKLLFQDLHPPGKKDRMKGIFDSKRERETKYTVHCRIQFFLKEEGQQDKHEK